MEYVEGSIGHEYLDNYSEKIRSKIQSVIAKHGLFATQKIKEIALSVKGQLEQADNVEPRIRQAEIEQLNFMSNNSALFFQSGI